MLTQDRNKKIAQALKAYRRQMGQDQLDKLAFSFAILILLDDIEGGGESPADPGFLPSQIEQLVTIKELQEFFAGSYYRLFYDEIHGTKLN